MELIIAAFRDPNLGVTFEELSRLLLPITGTLLGLVYAGLTYWTKAVAGQFKYSRDLIEDIIMAHGRILIDLLVGMSAIELFGILGLKTFASLSFWIVGLKLLVDLVKLVKERGYINTLTSRRTIPKNSQGVGRYLKTAWNAGLFGLLNLNNIVLTVVLIGYPAFLRPAGFRIGFFLSQKGGVVFLIVAFLYSIWELRALMLQGFELKDQIEDRLQSKNQEASEKVKETPVKWDQEKRESEKEIAMERLENLGVKNWGLDLQDELPEKWTSYDLRDKPVYDAFPIIRKSGSCHINLIIPYLDSAESTRHFIFKWSYKILRQLAQSKAEIHHYCLSFHRKDSPRSTLDTHIAMIRGKKQEILHLTDKGSEDKEFVEGLESKFLTKVIAEY